MDTILYTAVKAAVDEFLERRKKGGILLPTVLMVDQVFTDVMFDTGLRERPKTPWKPPILGEKNVEAD